MFDYIRGEINCFREEYMVIESRDIGYTIYTSNNTMKNIGELGEKVLVHTYMHVREDCLTLYGFAERRELDMFKLLQTVSKIGPKVALGILSSIDYDDINRAISFGDHDVLSKAPGIGKKTAQRMILELKDKIDIESLEMCKSEKEEISNLRIKESVEEEAVEALVSLGYSKAEIYKIISKKDIESKTTEEIIKIVLKEIGK